MKKPVSNPANKPRAPQSPPEPEEERRNDDRRKARCDGYTYVPIVGWYCRRTQTRRNDDSLE